MWASSISTSSSRRFRHASLVLLTLGGLLSQPISVLSQELASNVTDAHHAALAVRAEVLAPSSFQSFPWVRPGLGRQAQYVAETKVIPGIEKSLSDPQELQTDMAGFLQDYEIDDKGFKDFSDIGHELRPEDYTKIGVNRDTKFRNLKVCSKHTPNANLCYEGSFSQDGAVVMLQALFSEQDVQGVPRRRVGCIFCYLHVYAYFTRTQKELPTLSKENFVTSLSLVQRIYSDNVSDKRFLQIGSDIQAAQTKGRLNFPFQWRTWEKGSEQFTTLIGTYNGMVYGSFLEASQKAKKRDISKIHTKFNPGKMVAEFEAASGDPKAAQPEPQQPDCGSSSKDKGKRAFKGKNGKGTGSQSDSCPVNGGKTTTPKKGKTTKPQNGKATKPAKGKVTKPTVKAGKTGKTAKPKKTNASKSKGQH